MIFKDKKQIIIAFMIVIFFILLSVFITFKIKELSGEDKNNLSISINSKDITITNELPISDVLGKKIDSVDKNTGYATISIKNKSEHNTKYQVYITKKQSDHNQIKENYVKLYLSDSKDSAMEGFDSSLIPSFNDLRYLNDKPASKLLYNGTLDSNEEEKLVLRVWVSDTYALSDAFEDFSFDIGVREK